MHQASNVESYLYGIMCNSIIIIHLDLGGLRTKENSRFRTLNAKEMHSLAP